MENKKVFVLTGKNLEEVFNKLTNADVESLFGTLKSLLESTKSINSEVKKEADNKKVATYPKLYYIKNLAIKRGWGVSQMVDFFRELWDFYPAAALSLLMREIAVELDKNYKDHINDSDKIFVISVLDGKIHKVAKNHIKNYRNFAAFRTLEDARIACKTLQKELRFMFHNGKQENKKC